MHYFEDDETQLDSDGNFKLKCSQCNMYLDQLGDISVSRCKYPASMTTLLFRAVEKIEEKERREKAEKERKEREGYFIKLL
jgi:hypothetical protein